MTLKLSVGDKVRVYFYPPKTTSSFVEGIVERTDIRTMDGLCFSIRTTRDVILGHDLPGDRTHPYISLYEKRDDFEGRIEVLERVDPPEAEAAAEVEPTIEVEAETRNVVTLEPSTDASEDAVPQPATKLGGWIRLLRRAA